MCPSRPGIPSDSALLAEAEELVRESMALAAELGESGVAADLELADDPDLRLWQLCAMAPLGALDRQRLLEATRPVRLATLLEEVADARQCLRSVWVAR